MLTCELLVKELVSTSRRQSRCPGRRGAGRDRRLSLHTAQDDGDCDRQGWFVYIRFPPVVFRTEAAQRPPQRAVGTTGNAAASASSVAASRQWGWRQALSTA